MSHEMTHEEETFLALTVSISALHKLRDQFAGLGLQGMLANQHPYQASDEHMFARDAFKLADAMLRAKFKE